MGSRHLSIGNPVGRTGPALPDHRASRDFAPADWLVPAGLTALYFALIYLDASRRLWFDELLTYYIAKASSLPQVFALADRWDLNPPLLHLLAHNSLLAFRGNPAAVRLPSVVEFYLASVFVFWYVSRKAGQTFAAVAVMLLWFSSMFQYATEARPYALLCLWFACLLLSWDIAASRSRRTLALLGIALANIGLLCSHVFAPLSLLPFLAAETVRWRTRGKPDYPIWVALLLPLLLIAAYIPFYVSFKTVIFFPPAFQASLAKVFSFYWNSFGGLLACFSVPFVAALLATKGNWTWDDRKLRGCDWAIFITLAAVPLLLDLIMLQQHAPFWGRYCITSVVGMCAFLALLLSVATGFNRHAGLWAAAALCLLVLIARVAIPFHKNKTHPVVVNAAVLAGLRPDLPIVAASGLTFVEMNQNESPGLVSRLFYLLDRNAAIRYAHATIFEDMGQFRQAFSLPGTVEPYATFVRQHRDFLVLGTLDYPEDWLLRKLAADGAQITRLKNYPLPYKDKTVFLIHLNANRF